VKPLFFAGLSLLSLLGLASVNLNPYVTLVTVAFPPYAEVTGAVYYDGFLYASSHAFGVIYKVDMIAQSIRPYQFGFGSNDRGYIGITVDPNGIIWTSRCCTTTSAIGGLSKINLATMTETFVINATAENPADWGPPLYCSGYVYVVEYAWLFRVDVNTNEVTAILLPIPLSISSGIACDSSTGNVWFTDRQRGFLYEYSVSSGVVNGVSGFYYPAGVALHQGVVYIAENIREGDWSSESPAIAAYDTVTRTISRTYVTGCPFSLAVVPTIQGTFLIWSSTGDDAARTVGIGVLNGGFYAINVNRVMFLSSDANASIYFGYAGSAGVGKLSGWKAPPGQSLEKLAKRIR